MLRFLRRLYYSGDTALYLKSAECGIRFWTRYAGFKDGTHPGIVHDWFLDRGEEEWAELLRQQVDLRDFCQRRIGGLIYG